MLAVELKGMHIYDIVSLIIQGACSTTEYPTDVKNLITMKLRLRFLGENKNATSLY